MDRSDIQMRIDSLISVLEKQGPVVLLESQSTNHPASQKSYLAALPDSTLLAYGNKIVGYEDENKVQWEQEPWEALKEYHMRSDGWVFGYLGYDLKNYTESLRSDNLDPVGAPDLYFMNPGLIIEITETGYSILKGALPPDISNKVVQTGKGYSLLNFRPGISERLYCQKIQTAQKKIKEGDCYEINLSHQMEGLFSGDSYALYREMREAGPVPFGAYISFENLKICSASPERFLAKAGERVYSQPIKGTIHRGKDESEDERLMQWLKNSEKNRAENLMIVDLVRNDLGRIAKKGTVKVGSLFEIQSFGTVHQMVSTVEARADDHHPVDIIKACFPMGSMTGAPKVSAMKTIEELEDQRRGIYSGAIGFFTPEDNFDFNVVIRTAIIKGDRLFYSVGGAVTSDSVPESEWKETLVKASALVDAVFDKGKVAVPGDEADNSYRK